MENFANEFAAAGFKALAVDLYAGKVAKSTDEAKHAIGALDFVQAVEGDIE
jgi:dienelactone hydrolase